MQLHLKRRFLADTYTIGTLFIDGKRFCDTLEDTVRDRNKDGDLDDSGEGKVYGRTAIPYGTYDVVLNVSSRFGRELPRLLDVPHFEGILIHRGNTPEDTAGCILVGENRVKGQVINSTPYEINLVGRMKRAIAAGEKITITIE